MGLVMVRYGELALKGGNQRAFLRRLRRNMRDCLKRHGIQGAVSSVRGRVYVETDRVDEAVKALSRVFGIVSLSPVVSVSSQAEPAATLEAIKGVALEMAIKAGVDETKSFRVTAKRADKTFPIQSPEISRLVGEHVFSGTNGRIDLSKRADVTIGVDVRREGIRVFGETVPGPGGLPLGSGGRAVALISGGIDSPVAAWLLMKRGCGIIPVHFSQSEAETAKALENCQLLSEWAYGWRIEPIILSHHDVFGETVRRLTDMGQERWICVFCKRTIMVEASIVAQEHRASALITGESLGQVASQTVQNLEAISFGVPKPILRPLIGLDKVEIVNLAKRIGTYETSISDHAPCPFLPARPMTTGDLDEFRRILAELDSPVEAEGGGGA